MTNHDALAERIAQRSNDLALHCTNAMYADRFWQARFGDRGRRHADEDSNYHVSYLVSALRAATSTTFVEYARWLRSVLASRGMCTLHLALDFGHLIDALRAQVESPEVAVAFVQDGARGLAYTDGPAGSFDGGRDALRARVAASLGNEGYRLDEVLSFTADALFRDDLRSMSTHLTFLRTSLVRSDDERAALERTVDVLRAAALAVLSPDVGAQVVSRLTFDS